MQATADHLRHSGRTIVFVPTMGYLHEGHLSLIREGRSHGDTLVISVYVNPAQFAPGEDFEAYPRDLEQDLSLARGEGVDIVFTPTDRQLYPQSFQTYIELQELPQHLCGISRPIFFKGVATVVTKLFHIVKPHVAVFGEKDYQQLVVIRQMVKDLNFDIRIIGAPTVREPDGLAMSSRNNYLTIEQRPAALSLYQSLLNAKQRVEAGYRKASDLIEQARRHISTFPETHIDYISIVDPDSLVDVDHITGPVRMALAVKVGHTRLIDNMLLTPQRDETIEEK